MPSRGRSPCGRLAPLAREESVATATSIEAPEKPRRPDVGASSRRAGRTRLTSTNVKGSLARCSGPRPGVQPLSVSPSDRPRGREAEVCLAGDSRGTTSALTSTASAVSSTLARSTIHTGAMGERIRNEMRRGRSNGTSIELTSKALAAQPSWRQSRLHEAEREREDPPGRYRHHENVPEALAEMKWDSADAP